MDKIKSFTIYSEYYDLVTLLNEKDQEKLWIAIIKYMFDDVEPKLNDKQMKIFINLKRPLDMSKRNSLRSLGIGAPEGNKNALKKQTKNKPKTNQKSNQKTNQMSNQKTNTSNDVNVNVSNYDSNYVVNGNVDVNVNNKNNVEIKYFESIKVNSIFNEFLELRKKLKAVNSERAINSLVNKLNNYDEDTQYKMIENSIVNSWKGIFELKEKNERKDNVLETLKRIYNEQ